MNIQEYIESGILELYATGALSPSEMEEVEVLCERHPELAQELKSIEDSLIKFAEAQAIIPSSGMKKRIMDAIDAEEKKNNKGLIIQLNPRVSLYAIAACIALLIISNVGLVITWTNLNNTRAELAQLSEQNTVYAAEMVQFKQQSQYLSALRDPSTIAIELKGAAISPSSTALVYWNAKSQQVLMDFVNLPAADQDHQYQLWALVNGQPVDLGVFDGGTLADIKAMKTIQSADAFAVTLEPRGGSIQPTLDQMYLYAPVKS